MDQDRGEVNQSHLQTGIRLIKNSANVMHNGWVDTKMKQRPSMLVRRNLASKIHGSLLYRADLIPTELQIRAATILDARTSTSTTAEGEGLCATAEEVYATRTKGRGDGAGALERLAERGPQVHTEVKEEDVT